MGQDLSAKKQEKTSPWGLLEDIKEPQCSQVIPCGRGVERRIRSTRSRTTSQKVCTEFDLFPVGEEEPLKVFKQQRKMTRLVVAAGEWCGGGTILEAVRLSGGCFCVSEVMAWGGGDREKGVYCTDSHS